MSDDSLFSQFYFPESTRHEDKTKFRNRLLLYLEDFVNSGWPSDTYNQCRYQLGITIERTFIEQRNSLYNLAIHMIF